MPVLITCRVCKRENVSAGAVLTTTCAACEKAANDFQRKTQEAENETVRVPRWQGHQYGNAREEAPAGGMVVRRDSLSSDGTNGSNQAGVPGRGMPAGRQGSRTLAGDFVAKLTHAVGIPQCGGCQKRQKAMNQVNLSGPAIEVFRGLVQATINPDKVISDGFSETAAPSHDRAKEKR